MQNYDDLIQKLTEQNALITRLIEENQRLKDRLDIALNTIEFEKYQGEREAI